MEAYYKIDFGGTGVNVRTGFMRYGSVEKPRDGTFDPRKAGNFMTSRATVRFSVENSTEMVSNRGIWS
jgi:hypothetical protein